MNVFWSLLSLYHSNFLLDVSKETDPFSLVTSDLFDVTASEPISNLRWSSAYPVLMPACFYVHQVLLWNYLWQLLSKMIDCSYLICVDSLLQACPFCSLMEQSSIACTYGTRCFLHLVISTVSTDKEMVTSIQFVQSLLMILIYCCPRLKLFWGEHTDKCLFHSNPVRRVSCTIWTRRN